MHLDPYLNMELPVYKVLSRYGAPAPLYHCSDESFTVPDQSLTVKEIINRYSSGLLPSGILMSSDFEDDDESDFEDGFISPEMRQNKDLTDLYDLENEKAEYDARVRRVEKESEKPSEQIGSGTQAPAAPADV